ncbi:MAG: PqqD family protein [Lachnospiraceae bacterium]|jgi:hypothetical protein|nr:PqqD family protein [Lachnospiraceae bacterium]MBQ3783065.1 PqqD family protein [Lachnospiraceae bacterium]MCR4803849.1 PqqD family protein [Lachnospiraceae bacterium]
MKIKEDMMLRNINGEWMVIPMGERLMEFTGMLRLNESGAFMWNYLQEGTTKENLVEALLSEYEVDEQTATKAVDEFVEMLKTENILEQ